mgnify:CR=1 FL=1
MTNQGTDPAPATTTSFYLVNTSTGIKKSLKGGQNVPALAPGASDSPVVTVTAVLGHHRRHVLRAGLRRRAEERVGRDRDEQLRQCRAQTLTVAAGAESSRSARSRIPPRSVTPGASFKLTNSVRNVGSGDARRPATRSTTWSPPWTERRRISRAPRSSRPLNGGQTFSTQETLTVRERDPATGQYKVQACADGGDDAVESIEDDNRLTSHGHRQRWWDRRISS